MLNSKKIANEFYQSLGKLFYAVAMTDKVVRPVEVEKLRKFVRQYWLDVDEFEDEFETDAAYQIEIVFDWLQEEDKDDMDYFEEFKRFYNEHAQKFTHEIKSLILDTAQAIANSFAGTNKSEMIMIFKLKMLFDQNP
ncbi:MAG: hypothetical protein HKP38_05360 [Croceitalea sp.]|nr:hypothetical protein [Croceitalea sp.]MBT8238347.1 hypothetical protein [Croceitalea sp.]NNL08633.1 hypothetical protein [Croceitalea sp.]NNM19207.1 hypothetical protein [Croceitalea sp.]